MLKSLVISSILLASASQVSAGLIAENSWGGGYDTIKRVYAHNGGLAVIMDNHQYVATNGCDNGTHFVVRTSDANYEVKAKTLLAAYHAGHQIIIRWIGNDGCEAFINRFQVKP